MHKNRLLELTQMSDRSDRIGSKLKKPLITEATADDEFEQIKNIIDAFKNNTEEVNLLNNEQKRSVNPIKQRQLMDKMNRIISKNRDLLPKIQKTIRKINEEYDNDVKNGIPSNGYQVSVVTSKAKDAITEFKNTQQKITNNVKETIRRHAIIIQGEITDDEVESILMNPEKGQAMLQAKLFNAPSPQLEEAVSDIIDKYRDIIQLEKNMHECLEMTEELALLVKNQGQKLVDIEENFIQTKDVMEKVVDDLGNAKEKSKGSKKQMCCIILLLLMVIGAILIPVLITQL